MIATCIWQPKYCTRKVLIATNKVKAEKCYVYFCCDRNYPDLYSYDGLKVRQECKITTNGKIPCFEIPLDWLVNEGELPDNLKLIQQKEYEKYKNYKSKI